jgi:hypothetical protein
MIMPKALLLKIPSRQQHEPVELKSERAMFRQELVLT